MVYKKIKDTIPSLSGLLLAGLMVGGCKEKKDSPSTPAEQPSTENNKQKDPENKKAEGSEKAESQEFLEACSQFMKKILQGLGLDFLKKAPGPIILEEADLGVAGDTKVKNQGQKVADNLTRAAQSFSQYSCYTSIKDLLKDFAMLKYHVGSTAAGTKGLVHKHAVGQAFNAIAIPVNGLRKVYLSLEDQIDAKKSPKGFKKLAENDLPNEAEKLLDARTTHLKETHRFDDTIKTKLLDGDQLARFLTGKDDKGADKDHSVSGILKQGHEDVWIYNRTPDKACSKTVDDIPSDSEQAKKYLAERGAGISGTWKVKGASMPIIDPIDNGQLAPSGDHKFTVAPLLDAQKTPKTKAQIESIQAASFFTSPDATKGQSFNDSAARQQTLTNGQLLFTLFKGDTDYDFLKIAPGEAGSGKSVVLTSNDGNFQKLKSIISKKKTADEEFAKWLGAHISNNVPGIFHIPNINQLKPLIWVGEVEKASGTDEVNKDGEKDVTSDKLIGEASIIHNLYTNIVTYFGLTSDPVLSKLLASVKQLGNLHDTDLMKDSDATIEQRVLIYLAKKLTEDDFLKELHNTNVKNLEDNIDKWLKEITDYAIVRETKQGAYECTKVTSSLFYFLDQFCKQLENKKADASVTYAILKGEINKIRKQKNLQPEDTNFDIEAVRKALVKDCDRLKGVLELDVTDLINRQADITPGDLPDYLSFVSADIAELNKIRKDYKEKKASKANAPAA